MKKCAEIMTREVECCLPTTSIDEVAKQMKAKNIGPIVVVDALQTKKLVGIITDRDLAIKVLAEGRDPKNTKVEDVMTRNVQTCTSEDGVEQALNLMEKSQVRRLPIVNDTKRVEGIITQADIANRLKDQGKTAELVEAVSKASATARA